MGKYTKDINYIASQHDVEKMLERATTDRDRFIVSVLYLTGARPSEILELKKGDIYEDESYIKIRLVTKKLGRSKGFTIRERTLEIDFNAPFLKHVTNWHNTSPNELLIDITTDNLRQKIYQLSNNKLCPYHFRHSRLTKLSRNGASLDELMYWKGSKDLKSVSEYLKAKPIGRKLVID